MSIDKDDRCRFIAATKLRLSCSSKGPDGWNFGNDPHSKLNKSIAVNVVGGYSFHVGFNFQRRWYNIQWCCVKGNSIYNTAQK